MKKKPAIPKIQTSDRYSIENYDFQGTRRIYPEVRYSLILCTRGRPGSFKRMIDSLCECCSSKKPWELLIKLDDDDNSVPEYIDILKNSAIQYKLLVYPRHYGFWDTHLFASDLVRMSTADILYPVGDDFLFESGDWLALLDEFKCPFKDRICVFEMPGDFERNNHFMAFTRTWFDVLGVLSPIAEADSWMKRMSISIGRFVERRGLNRRVKLHHMMTPEVPMPNWKARKGNINELIAKFTPIFASKMEKQSV